MSERGPKRGEPKKPQVVRRPGGERKRLPDDLERFAGGDDDALWRRPVKRRINDPRPVLLVPGVANRDARAVYEARERRAKAARDAGDRELLALELAEASRLGIWRGHSLVSWDTYVEDVLELSPKEAATLRDEGGARTGGVALASESVIATWMRAEAGAIEATGADVAVRFDGERLHVELPIDSAPAALAAMGRRAAPLARDQAESPDSVLDRPKGVPRLSRLIERERRGDE